MFRRYLLLLQIVNFFLLKFSSAFGIGYTNAWGNEAVIEASADVYVFNVTSDPLEEVDLFDSFNDTNFILRLEERRNYWSLKTREYNIPPDLSERTTAWASCGRVCPWVGDDDDQQLIVDQIYFNADAPHIVFVLVDDWGYNDIGLRSTYLSWTTPTVDRLASEGILLGNYYTNEMCGPSRASLLTGRYSLRLGVHYGYQELPATEVTLANELKSAGYMTYMVGKWHLGQSSYKLFPTNRGFDYFYGYVNGYESYYTKEYAGYVDLFENTSFVTDEDQLSSSLHAGYLYQTQAEKVIKSHSENYPNNPMFLYYPMHLVHYPWTAPLNFLDRCVSRIEQNYTSDYVTDDASAKEASTYALLDNYCAMVVMMDEAIANLTCALSHHGFAENTVLIISGDNGAESSVLGGSYPFRGHKATGMRGALANTAIIHSRLIPKTRRGTTYNGLVHITDWLPTLMNIATAGEWNGSYIPGTEIDGFNVWHDILKDEPTERSEIVFISNNSTVYVSLYEDLKYVYHTPLYGYNEVVKHFVEDFAPNLSHIGCLNPSLINSRSSITTWSPFSTVTKETRDIFLLFFFISMISMIAIAGLIMGHRQYEKQSPAADIAHERQMDGETDPLVSQS